MKNFNAAQLSHLIRMQRKVTFHAFKMLILTRTSEEGNFQILIKSLKKINAIESIHEQSFTQHHR
jgi:hypothetical protein